MKRNKKENKLPKKISLSTVNKTLNNCLSKPKNIRKVFFLSSNEKIKRLNFLRFMKQNQIFPDKIFFTDESIFNVASYFNRNYKVRLSRKTSKLIKNGNENALKKVTREFHKNYNGIMVSGGICEEGLGKLIFHSGNVNTFAYKQVLNYYREDLDNFQAKYFQQDGARAHSSKGSQVEIKRLFGDRYIPTWENGPYIPQINGENIPKWPPNSPDLSPIELIWSIIKGMLNIFPPTTLEEFKEAIQNIWNSISSDICQKIIKHMEKRWELCIKHKGRRLDRELLRKINSGSEKMKITLAKTKVNGVRISYNDKFVLKLKKKDLREKRKKLKEEIKKENELQAKFEKLMKLKPKDYKNIPDKEKYELKFSNDLQVATRQALEENIVKINKMTPLEYLNILNDEMKKKLIGLCLNKKIYEAFENDSYEEETKEDGIRVVDETDEEEESEESEEEFE